MIWNHPAVFLMLLAFPPFFYLVARKLRTRRREIEATFSEGMRVRLFGSSSQSILIAKYAFLLLSLIAFLCVFAGPRFGEEKEVQKVFGRDVFILFDVSDSMLAEDVSPNRLTVARLDVEDLLDAAVGDRIGLVAFAGSAQVEIPLTTDYDFFRELLRKVDTKTVRLGGTATGDAIRLALKRFGQEPERKRLIFLITDGEDHDSFPLEAAKNAAEMGVPIVAIGIGSPQGAKIPVFNVNGDRVGYKTFDGQEAVSKTDVETLKEIAKLSKGRYFYADSKLNFADVYKTSVEIQDRGEISEDSRVVLKDRYQPFLAFGLFSFMLFYFCPARVSLRKNGNLTTFVFLATSLTFVLANETYAIPQDENGDKISATSKPKDKNQEIKTYNRSLKIAEKDFDEFVALQTELADAKTPEVSSRANYNLAAVELQKARENAETLKSERSNSKEENAFQDGDSENARRQDDGETQTKDPVEEYDAARRERERRRQEITNLADTSSFRFFNAHENRKLGRESLQNAEIASNWRKNFDEYERGEEKKLRVNALSNSEDHLRWLKGELNKAIGSVQDANPQKLSADFYRSLDKKKLEIKDFDDDVDSIAAQLCSRLANPSEKTSLQNNPAALPPQQMSSLQEPDPEGAEKISQALNLFKARTLDASKKLDHYDADTARKELRRAETQLTTFYDVPARYDELVLERSRDESRRYKELEQNKLKTSDLNQFDEYRWNRETLALSVDEIMRKARRIVEAHPEKLEDSRQETSPPGYTEWDDSSDSDEPVFDPNDSDSSPTVRQSNEDPVLRSAHIALEREQELKKSVEIINGLVQSDLTQDRDKKQLLQTQKSIAEILDEITKPFQEDNQQDQNSKNRDKNRQNQDSNQQNQNPDDQSRNQESKNSNQQEQGNDRKHEEDEKIPDELERSESPKENESSDQNENKNQEKQEKEVSVEIEEPEQKKKKAGEEKKTEEQKQADELMKRVFRRQKDAEPQREAVRQALKKREKSGKDW